MQTSVARVNPTNAMLGPEQGIGVVPLPASRSAKNAEGERVSASEECFHLSATVQTSAARVNPTNAMPGLAPGIGVVPLPAARQREESGGKRRSRSG